MEGQVREVNTGKISVKGGYTEILPVLTSRPAWRLGCKNQADDDPSR